MNILVLCTGNSARSILLESILNHEDGDRIRAFSAGSDPAGRVHPQTLDLLTALGHDTSRLRSKSWDEFAAADAPRMDVVITVCGSAAGETCPVWPGAPVRAHWGVEDPAALPQDEQPRAFRGTYEILNRRAAALLALPLDAMDAAALKTELEVIGTLT